MEILIGQRLYEISRQLESQRTEHHASSAVKPQHIWTIDGDKLTVERIRDEIDRKLKNFGEFVVQRLNTRQFTWVELDAQKKRTFDGESVRVPDPDPARQSVCLERSDQLWNVPRLQATTKNSEPQRNAQPQYRSLINSQPSHLCSKKFWCLEGTKVPNSECLFVHRKQGLFLSENVDDMMKWLAEGRNMASVWKKVMKLIDYGEPTSFAWPVKTMMLLINSEQCLNLEFSAGATENLFARVGHTSRKNSRVVIRHGKTCEEVRGDALWIGPKKKGAIVHSFIASLRWKQRSRSRARTRPPVSVCVYPPFGKKKARKGRSSRSAVLRAQNYRRTRVAQPTKGVETRPAREDPDPTQFT